MRIWCMNCGKSVSTEVPSETIVRAWVECPECIEKRGKVGTAKKGTEVPESDCRLEERPGEEMGKIDKELIDRLIREADAGAVVDMALLKAGLEFRRDQYGLSQRQFARVLGTTPANYSSFLRHGRGLSLRVLRRAYAIGVPASVLLQGKGWK